MKKLIILFLTIVALLGLNSCLTEYDPVQDDIIVRPTVTIRPYYYRYYDYRPYYYHRPYYHRHHRHF